ncbi:MAG: FtsX-like permease family protein [Ignavibacteriaceae bacterium]|jgi:putative ABC transport system permease protein
MKILKLIFKNTLRHKLRTFLTIFGIAIAVIAFGVLRTFVTAWYQGVEASAANRLIVRQAVSFIFPLPYSYREKILQVGDVTKVTFANWFGGVYIDQSNFFARLAVDPDTYFDVYNEFVVPNDQLETFKKERNTCVIGAEIAKKYNLKIGDVMTVDGDIYPGRWEFIVRGIYQPKFKSTDATQMLFHWDYVDERMKQEMPGRAGDVGWYVVMINNPAKASNVSNQIDALFKNSSAETKTETESAFQQGFIQASGAIITSMNFISFIIIGIIMLVLGNTMIMSARERTREYAVLKTLGFSGKHLAGIIMGESLMISLLGGIIGLFLTYPIVVGLGELIPRGVFPVFEIKTITLVLAASAALIIGIAAAIFPIQRALKTKIIDGFRFVG